MSEVKVYSSWQEKATYGHPFTGAHTLAEDEVFKSLVAAMEPGQKIPSHPEGLAVYYFLEGQGWIIVDGERIAVSAGTIVVTPAGSSRGVEAETRLAFLASRVSNNKKKNGDV